MPADTENCARYRGGLAQEWFASLSNFDLSQKTSPSPTKDPVQATFPVDPSILILQMVMQYNGYWDKPDGHKSKAFFDELEQFVQDMKLC